MKIPYRLAEGMALHFAFMWLFIINGVLYISYTFISVEWKQLLPNKHSFRESLYVLLHDIGLYKKELPSKKYNGAQRIAYTMIPLIGMSTPDDEYYIGMDTASNLHPQTILCYEVNGPIPMQHGYPLRLIAPVKYGVKNLKRIGTIYSSDSKPADYWAERGYDYYAGL